MKNIQAEKERLNECDPVLCSLVFGYNYIPIDKDYAMFRRVVDLVRFNRQTSQQTTATLTSPSLLRGNPGSASGNNINNVSTNNNRSQYTPYTPSSAATSSTATSFSNDTNPNKNGLSQTLPESAFIKFGHFPSFYPSPQSRLSATGGISGGNTNGYQQTYNHFSQQQQISGLYSGTNDKSSSGIGSVTPGYGSAIGLVSAGDGINGNIYTALTYDFGLHPLHDLRERIRMRLTILHQNDLKGSGLPMSEIAQKLSSVLLNLISIPSFKEKLGVLCLIEQLADFVNEVEDRVTVIRLVSAIRIIFQKPSEPDDELVLEVASKALGRLLLICEPNARGEIVKFQCERALEWLQIPIYAPRRLGAAFILGELAKAAPVNFTPFLSSFFGLIGAALHDSKYEARIAARNALQEAINVANSRIDNLQQREDFYRRLYGLVSIGVNNPLNPAVVHGSLLAAGELLELSKDFAFLQDHLSDLFSAILSFRNDKDLAVRQIVMTLIPKCAKIAPGVFQHMGSHESLLSASTLQTSHQHESGENLLLTPSMGSSTKYTSFFDDSISYLLKNLDKKRATTPSDRNSAFLAIGELSLYVEKQKMSNVLQKIVENIIKGLQPSKSSPNTYQYALAAVVLLARGLGNEFATFNGTYDLLDTIFGIGNSVTPMFIETILSFSEEATYFRPVIGAHLIHMLSFSLFNEEFPMLMVHPPYHINFASIDRLPLPEDVIDDAETQLLLYNYAMSLSSANAPMKSLFKARHFQSCESAMRRNDLADDQDIKLDVSKSVQSKVLKRNNMGATSSIDDDVTCLILFTFGRFDFSGIDLLAFSLEKLALVYFSHPNELVRLEAVKSCSRILHKSTSDFIQQAVPKKINDEETGMQSPLGLARQQSRQGRRSSIIEPTFDATLSGQARPRYSSLSATSSAIGVSLQPTHPHHGRITQKIVSQIINLMLGLVVTDPSPVIRLAVLSFIEDPAYELYISQTEALKKILFATKDTSFDIRRASLRVLSRMSRLNPSFVLPNIRSIILSFIDDLEATTSVSLSTKEESSTLLSEIIEGLVEARECRSTYMYPYLPLIFDSLISKLKINSLPGQLISNNNTIADAVNSGFLSRLSVPISIASNSNTIISGISSIPVLQAQAGIVQGGNQLDLYSAGITIASLRTLSSLASVDDQAREKCVDMLAFVVQHIQDQSNSRKREAALSTLGKIVQKTGAIIAPYIRFPGLLETLLAIISHAGREVNAPWSLQSEAIKAIGIVGALDPSDLAKYNSSYSTTTRLRIGVSGVNNAFIGVLRGSGMNMNQRQDYQMYDDILQESFQAFRANKRSYQTKMLPWLRKGRHNVKNLVTIMGIGVQAQEQSNKKRNYYDAEGRGESLEDSLLAGMDLDDADDNEEIVLEPSSDPSKSEENLRTYSQSIAVSSLIKILKDPSLSSNHVTVADALSNIGRSLGISKALYFLPKIVPPLLRAIKTCGDREVRGLFMHCLAAYIQLAQRHVKRFIPDIFEIISSMWDQNPREILGVIDSVAFSLNEDFSATYLNRVLPGIIKSIELPSQPELMSGALNRTNVNINNQLRSTLRPPNTNQTLLSDNREQVIRKGLHTVEILGYRLSTTSFIRTIMECILKIIGARGICSDRTRVIAIKTFRSMGWFPAITEYTSPVIRVLASCMNLKYESIEIQDCSFDALIFFSSLLKLDEVLSVALPLIPLNKRYEYEARLQKYFTRPKDSLHNSLAELNQNNIENEQMRLQQEQTDDTNQSERGENNTIDMNGNGAGALLEQNSKIMGLFAEVSRQNSEEDWFEWMKNFSVELLRESPDPFLRACSSVAQVYRPLSRELFNAAFLSFWVQTSSSNQSKSIHSLNVLLSHPNIPMETLQTFLNLAEFMEHDEKMLPIEARDFSIYAKKCHAYAKALHYKELEFQKSPESCIEDLIAINSRLEQPEAALGILEWARKQNLFLVSKRESNSSNSTLSRKASVRISRVGDVSNSKDILWYEELGRWREALKAYSEILETNPNDFDAILGRVRCFNALGEYEKIVATNMESDSISGSPTINNHFFMGSTINPTAKQQTEQKMMNRLVARALWALGRWEEMDKFTKDLNDAEGSLLRAATSLHDEDYPDTEYHLENARRFLAGDVSALVGESYNRSYNHIVMMQQLAELEEIYEFKLEEKARKSERERVDALKRLQIIWDFRLRGCQRNVHVWQQILTTRMLLIHPTDDVKIWIEFAGICRKSMREGLAHWALSKIGVTSRNRMDMIHSYPEAVFASLKLEWAFGDKSKAVGEMERLVTHLDSRWSNSWALASAFNLTPDMSVSRLNQHGNRNVSISARRKLASKCRLTFGEWITEIDSRSSSFAESFEHSLSHFYRAIELDNTYYKAWHLWALTCFRAFESFRPSERRRTEPVANFGGSFIGDPSHRLSRNAYEYVIPALHGFFQSIAASGNVFSASLLQDILRVLTLWFDFGRREDVSRILEQGYQSVPINTWLVVIPQLIARIQETNNRLLREVLLAVGREHPQALVYPLTVAARSSNEGRKRAAQDILDELSNVYPDLLAQAKLVSRELMRVAILLPEEWYEAIEEASKVWYPIPTGPGFAEKKRQNYEAMMQIFNPLIERMQREPESPHEQWFMRSHGDKLRQAVEAMRVYNDNRYYLEEGGRGDMHDVWTTFKHLYNKISDKVLSAYKSFEMRDISPLLEREARNLELAVPGSYIAGQDIVKIKSFSSTVRVFPTKQRPRKITIHGSDGKSYQYLLKGHEDLRQDERVMQLFGLVNSLLSSDQSETIKYDLNIQRYIVIPLSHNGGLIGWVPGTDTFHQLIRKYREKRELELTMEQELINEQTGGTEKYDALTTIQKVEMFEYAQHHAIGKGEDMGRIIWLNSPTAEVWIERRTMYTRSLATMSMVGYILGLGDRHPSNLMLDRASGRVVHIDFGDCFEVAMRREKYPEKVPFRLTRMLVKAMEVSGVEGNFRSTCETVMGILRDNQDSVLAMLEAFVHDPLINWRLLAQAQATSSAATSVSMGSQPFPGVIVDSTEEAADQQNAKAVRENEVGSTVSAATVGRERHRGSLSVIEEADVEGMEEVEYESDRNGNKKYNSKEAKSSENDTDGDDIEEGIIIDGEEKDDEDDFKAMNQSSKSRENHTDGDDIEEGIIIDGEEKDDEDDSKVMNQLSKSYAVSESMRINSMATLQQKTRRNSKISVTDAGGDTGDIANSMRFGRSQRNDNRGIETGRSVVDRANRDRQYTREAETSTIPHEEVNARAVAIIQRVKDKLTGKDFAVGNVVNQNMQQDRTQLSIEDQVERLILQATSNERLCVSYVGWCAYW